MPVLNLVVKCSKICAPRSMHAQRDWKRWKYEGNRDARISTGTPVLTTWIKKQAALLFENIYALGNFRSPYDWHRWLSRDGFNIIHVWGDLGAGGITFNSFKIHLYRNCLETKVKIKKIMYTTNNNYKQIIAKWYM